MLYQSIVVYKLRFVEFRGVLKVIVLLSIMYFKRIDFLIVILDIFMKYLLI